MEEKHNEYMREAIQLSEESLRSGGGPFGAIIVKDGAIIGRGVNRVTIHNDPTAHGEIIAIREACKNLDSFQLDGCVLYTSTEPCPMCLGAIYWARPDAVYYGNTKDAAASIGFDDSFIYDEIKTDYSARKIKFHQILEEEAEHAFLEWSRKTDKVEY